MASRPVVSPWLSGRRCAASVFCAVVNRQSSYAAIYAVVRRIPSGRVATYGQVARLAGLGRNPRLVGYALHALPDGSRLPWHRVVNSRGAISTRSEAGPEAIQRSLLEREGVCFDGRGRLDLKRWQWRAVGPR